MDRRNFMGLSLATLAAGVSGSAMGQAAAGKKGVFFMNRIAPSIANLYIANLDGTGERKLLADAAYEYNGTPSADGQWVVFTSERNGDGQSDIFRARIDGTGIEPLVVDSAMDDAGVLSPDGTKLAFVSTRNGYRANIWVMDVASRALTQLTGTPGVHGEIGLPDCYFRPHWSPDGQWIVFSTDRNTRWYGHDGGQGWEHTQELALYMIRPDGRDFHKIAQKPGYCLGSPKFSPDGKRVCFHEMTTEATWGARRPNYIGKTPSQIVSIELETGEWTYHTTGNELKIQPQFVTNDEIGYLVKYGPNEGLYYTSGRKPVLGKVRSPNWTADGKSVIYEKTSFFPIRPFNKPLYSWDNDWSYRHLDVFPQIGRDGWLVYTEKQLGDSSIVIMRPDGTGKTTVFQSGGHGLDLARVKMGLAGAFQPAWSADGKWIVFGLGYWFIERAHETAAIWRVKRDGTGAEQLTDGTMHSGFPSVDPNNPDRIVFRVWSEKEKGLRLLDAKTRKITVLTEGLDNLPGWSPDGKEIVFTRKRTDNNFDVYTITPDGKTLRRITTHDSSDGHAVWSWDNRIMWSGSEHGFRDEAALYEMTFQQYGQIYVADRDGSNKRMVTDTKWEDSMPIYVPDKMFQTAAKRK
ncbi:PD40 domain-containing protein [Novosphingobium flavum]|uniref:PD40 domain-containing protein n=1 Tax=Novosphingobium flavum TaxID=1778672 RepID=A0A7X1KM38_9SPHN|nr:PD40 domain-containing protein [Novosphingobium flavum]MBC2665983.1 PD40 domain-containing protein [Novosphingobium flavum]